MDQIAAMRLFRRVAETESFTRAAGDLGLSQPTVSRAVSDLEASLGAQLLRRSTRAVTLTEAGARFLVRTHRILEEIDAAEAEARGLESNLVGLLRVQAPLSYGRAVLAGQFARFLLANPHVRGDLLLSDATVDLAAEGCDLAIRIGDLADSSLKARPIGATRRSPFASPAYFVRAGRPERPEDLRRHNCLLFTRLREPRVWRFARGDEVAAIEVEGTFGSDAVEALREAALVGLGIGLSPAWLVTEDVVAGRLEPVLPGWLTPVAPIHAVWPDGRRLGAKARAFVDFLVAEAQTG